MFFSRFSARLSGITRLAMVGRVLGAAGLCLSIGLAAGCGLQPSNPDELFDHAVSGLSGKDNFAFLGQTQVSLGGLPPQPGVAFRGTVTGHNQLSMQVVTGEPNTDLNASPKQGGKVRKSQGATVQLSRKQDAWIVAGSESPQEGEAGQLVRWNPLSHLERLNVMNKEVTTERGAGERGVVMLAISPEASDVTSQLRAELETQLQLLQTDRKLKELQEKLQLTSKQTAAMRGEVEKSLTEARTKIEEMKNSLTAESTYRLGVDRKSNLPRSMTISTKMHYTSAGSAKEELSEVAYTFGE